MDQKQFSIGLNKFKQALSETYLNTLGKDLKFSQKLRKITPFKLASSLIACFSTPIETISDMHRSFNELNKESVQYKPFHKQLAKKTFPTFMRGVVSHLLNNITNKILVANTHSPFARFSNIFIQDGTAYGIKSNLKHTFPGKFEQAPAAVQLHTTMSLLEDEAVSVTLTPFIDAETNYLPDANNLINSLLLADRCYLNIPYMNDVNQLGGFFILRGKHHINPLVKEAYIGKKKVKKFIGKKLKFIKISKNVTVDVVVEWKFLGGRMECRVVIKWNPETKEYMYLVTNLSRTEFSADQIFFAYRLRWQVELLFKEWKSYANLQRFDTSNPYIAEGLIWSALAAAIIKRFIAHLTQQVKKIIISTRIVAMCAGRKIITLVEKLINKSYTVNNYLLEIIHYLGDNAKRTNPIRDKEKGRFSIGFIGIGPLKD